MSRHAARAQVYSCNGDRLRSIPESEAWEMTNNGSARRLSRLKAAQMIIQLVYGRKPDGKEGLVGSTITLGEMEANAGTRGERRPAKHGFSPGNFVDRAMTKVELWPEIGDERAIRVGPRPVASI